MSEEKNSMVADCVLRVFCLDGIPQSQKHMNGKHMNGVEPLIGTNSNSCPNQEISLELTLFPD